MMNNDYVCIVLCQYRMFIVFCAAIGAIVFAYFALQDPAELEAKEEREREEVDNTLSRSITDPCWWLLSAGEAKGKGGGGE